LVSVATKSSVVQLPADTRAGLTFQATGDLLAHDGINAINAPYTAKGQDIWVRPGATTLVAYVGDDPAQLLAIAAIGRLTLGNEDRTSAVASIIADGERLEITVAEFTLRLRRSDAAVAAL
jgi:hypothetical protein